MNLKEVLKALADAKVILSVLVGAGGLIEAYTKSIGNAELDQIVGFVIAGAALAVALISAAQNAFAAGLTEGQKSLRRG